MNSQEQIKRLTFNKSNLLFQRNFKGTFSTIVIVNILKVMYQFNLLFHFDMKYFYKI